MENVQAIYAARFAATGLEKRKRVWDVLCARFFNDLVGPDKAVLDLACGYGEFINTVAAGKRYAVDMNEDSPRHLRPDVRFFRAPSTHIAGVADGEVDVVFTSNFLEHLPDKAACDATFDEVKRILKPGGRFIVLGPNIRYAYREYWDYYDHHLPLSHLSLEEGLVQKGFSVVWNIPRFLPYTMKSRAPSGRLAIRAYLAMPFVWRFFGKQFLVVAEKP